METLFFDKKIAGGTLVLLADGMGGLDFPEQASKIVCEAILDYFESYNASDSLKDYSRELRICR